MRRPLANALDIDLAGGLTDQVTPHAGSALLIEVMRRSGVIAAAERHLPAKRSTKGLRQGELVEAFMRAERAGRGVPGRLRPAAAGSRAGGAAGVRPAGRIDGAGNGWISSMIRSRWPVGRSRAASSRPRAPGWPGCGRWSSTACGPTARRSSRGQR